MDFRVLEVDLENQKTKEKKENVKEFIGGRGFGVKSFLKDLREDKIVIAAGPLTGILGVPCSSKVCEVCYSPYGFVTHSVCGGKFGMELRFSGYDAIVIKGKSCDPVWISIINGEVEFHDASGLKNKDTFEKTKIIKSNFEKDVAVLCIGPAGENGVKFANVMHENRALGRTGHGYTWGKNNLYAIAVYGESHPEPYDKKLLIQVFSEVLHKLKKNKIIQDLTHYGTFGMLLKNVRKVPYKYFDKELPLDEETINRLLKEWESLIKDSSESCANCPIACGKKLKSNRPGFEYCGGFVSFGTLLDIWNLDKIADIYYLSNKYGLDSWSLGNVLSLALKLNLIKKEEMEKVIYDIAYGKSELKEGAEYLAKKYNTEAMCVRGVEMGLYYPSSEEYNLALLTSERGFVTQIYFKGDVFLKEEGDIVEKVIKKQALECLCDSLVVCSFLTYALDFEDFEKIFYAVTGLDLNLEKIARQISLEHKKLNEKLLKGIKKPSIVKVDEKLLEKYRESTWKSL